MAALDATPSANDRIMVTDALAAKYAPLPRERIEEEVTRSWAELSDQARFTNFFPVLVERRVAARLRAELRS